MPADSDGKISFVRRVPEPRVATFAAAPAEVEIDLARTALLIVDMQNDFLHPDGWFPRAGVDPSPLSAVVPAVGGLADAARRHAVPVVWLNWGVRPDRANLTGSFVARAADGGRRPTYADPAPGGRGRVLVRDDWGAAVIDALPVADSDLIVHKHRPSGFWDNELDSILRVRDVTTLLFAGINIDRCVFATLTDACFLGYDCVLVEDACATPSPEHVRDAVCHLTRLLYGVTATTRDVIAAMSGSTPAAARTPPTEQERITS